jgi:hypothetical protein
MYVCSHAKYILWFSHCDTTLHPLLFYYFVLCFVLSQMKNNDKEQTKTFDGIPYAIDSCVNSFRLILHALLLCVGRYFEKRCEERREEFVDIRK